MTKLNEFQLLPLLDSYLPTTPSGVLTVGMEDGSIRQREEYPHMPHRTPVSFIAKGAALDYLFRFWRIYRAKPFQMRLILNGQPLAWYECNWLSAKPSQKPLGNGLVQWTNEILIQPQVIDVEVDKGLIFRYLTTDGDPKKSSDLLNEIVNVDMPNALGGMI